MSDEDVRAAIEQMEAWMADPTWEPDPDALTQWNSEFQEAMAHAVKGDEWPDLVARAHAAGSRVEVRVARLIQEQAEVKAELDAQDRGNRALQGYRASTR